MERFEITKNKIKYFVSAKDRQTALRVVNYFRIGALDKWQELSSSICYMKTNEADRVRKLLF
jgi:hypothetical protein